MSVAKIKLAVPSGASMDRTIERSKWSPMRWPLAARVGASAVGAILFIFVIVAFVVGDGARTLRVPVAQLTIVTVQQDVFHDLTPLRARIVPRDTIYLDAIEGGRVERVLVESGDYVKEGQPLIEFGNTELQLSVIREEANTGQTISQLQQTEISLVGTGITNERQLAEIDRQITDLTNRLERRQILAAAGASTVEEREKLEGDLAHQKRVREFQLETNKIQAELRARILPINAEKILSAQRNLEIVRAKLDNLTVRAPVTGRITDIDLKIGENRSRGQRLAVITPDTGYKLAADVDEFYISRVHKDQTATLEQNGREIQAIVTRVNPQVKDGRFAIDLAFRDADPPGLVTGQAMQGRLMLGDDQPALVIPTGAFLERTGGDWLFVLTDDNTAERRRIKVGRRNAEQVEIASGLVAGDRVITSDYTGYERLDRIVMTK